MFKAVNVRHSCCRHHLGNEKASEPENKAKEAIVEIPLMVEQRQWQMISIAMTIVNNNGNGKNNAMASKYLTLL